MAMEINDNPVEILRSAKVILLVDWPDAGVPRSLIKAGFTVYSFSPEGYTLAGLVNDLPEDNKGLGRNEENKLVFNRLEEAPALVDIVNIYRPENEHADIIKNHVLPLNAEVVWLHPPGSSAQTRALARDNDLIFIEGANISELAGNI